MESVEFPAAAKSLLSLLLEAGADPNVEMEDGWLALTSAIFHRRQDIAELLLQHKANADINGRMYGTPLRLSIKLDQPSTTHLLVRYADVNRVPQGEDPPLIYAARKQRNSHAWLLLDAGARADIQDSKGWTALHFAVHSGNDSLAWLLVSKGASPDIPNQEMLSPLHLAVESRNYAMVQLFCLPRTGSKPGGGSEGMHSSQGPSLALLDHQGMSPLHRAIQSNNIDIVQTLFRSGGQQCLDIKDAHGATPLHHAVTLDWYDGMGHIAFFLLDKDANPDACDNTGKTPLMWAAQKGDRNFVVLLLERLDNRNKQDADGKTAEDLAEELGREDVVYCIRFYGATL
jgi:ankyrin repeat protein